jgi:hypothetical protein
MKRLDAWATRLGWVLVILSAIYFAGSVALR